MQDDRRSRVERTKPSAISEAEWRRLLTPQQYRVLRAGGTEAAHSSPLNAERRAGLYRCAGCGHPLFDAKAKFDADTGYPSFRECREGAVGTVEDRSRHAVLAAV